MEVYYLINLIKFKVYCQPDKLYCIMGLVILVN